MNKGKSTMAKSTVIAEPGKQEIIMTRNFNAPRDLVFKVMTDPTHIPKWWGKRDDTTIVKKMDARPGGQWHYVERTPDGSEYGFFGVYHAVVSPERLVYTYEFDGMPGHVGLVTATFEEEGGKTKITETSLFPSVDDRDAVIQAGMEEGANETFDRLAELLATMK
jgi:uncharacterized protein YndB with AHSA1/START domain